jgi:mRNA-degrading endonuclease toxin of MazEF toxin-antitoxin module
VLSTVVIVPLTTQSKRASFANNVWLPANEAGRDRDWVGLRHQTRVLDRRKLIRRIGELAPERLSEIEVAVAFGFASVIRFPTRFPDADSRREGLNDSTRPTSP